MSYRRFNLAEIGWTATAATAATDSAVKPISVATVAAVANVASDTEPGAKAKSDVLKSHKRSGREEVSGRNVPKEWAEALAALGSLVRPAEGFTPNQWHRIVNDAARFVENWSAHAVKQGWGILDVFGVHPLAPAARYDAMGLVLLIRGGEVIALDERRATIRMPSGAELTYLKRPRKERRPNLGGRRTRRERGRMDEEEKEPLPRRGGPGGTRPSEAGTACGSSRT